MLDLEAIHNGFAGTRVSIEARLRHPNIETGASNALVKLAATLPDTTSNPASRPEDPADPTGDLRDFYHRSRDGREYWARLTVDEIRSIIHDDESREARDADAALRVPPEKLRALAAGWLVENAEGRPQPTSKIVEAILGRRVSSTKDPERRDYMRCAHHIALCSEELAKRGYDMVAEPIIGDFNEKLWSVRRRPSS